MAHDETLDRDFSELRLLPLEEIEPVNEILKRALKRVREEKDQNPLPTAHYTHHSSHSSHGNGW
jgi:hypothetical protein